ncbi:MAG: hypothetical protein JNM93_13795 [Bacteriovoracaceae bacterium]|nr:hypothetical protein [Bacteriovoracaceae bacterium]
MTLLILFTSFLTFAADKTTEFDAVTKEKVLKIHTLFKQGDYAGSLEKLSELEQNYTGPKKDLLNAFLAYWRGVANNRIQDYSEAINNFAKADENFYRPDDFYYEYAQALYAMDKLKKSRDYFMRSALRKYKAAVSLYYVAFISQTLRDFKVAVKAYRRIETLDDPEKDSVIQASKMQIAEIYLNAVDKKEDQVGFLQKRVIREFEEALKFEPDSNLSRDIRRKMLAVQDKYGLLLLKMRNGRPTIFPRAFVKVGQEIAYDSNVIFSPDNLQLSASDTGSFLSRTDVYMRNIFYSGNSVSIQPEFRSNLAVHANRSNETIYASDNLNSTAAVRTAFEHWMWGKPASVLFDYEFNYVLKDLNAENSLIYNSSAHVFMIGERFNWFNAGETIMRLKYRDTTNTTDTSSSTITSGILEQMVNFESGHILLFYGDMSLTRVETDTFDTNSMTFRLDWIAPRIFDYATPTLGLGYTYSDVINDDSRGTETLINPTFKLTRVVNDSLRANLKFDYMKNTSGSDSFAYNKFTAAFGLEWIF